MNDLYNKIDEEYKIKKEYDCTITPKNDKLKFTVTLTAIEPKEENNETIKNEITEENPEEKKNEEKENIEEDVEADDDDKNKSFEIKDCVINIELFKSKNGGYLLRFLRKSGDLEEFYKNLRIMYSYAEDLV